MARNKDGRDKANSLDKFCTLWQAKYKYSVNTMSRILSCRHLPQQREMSHGEAIAVERAAVRLSHFL